MSSDSGQGAVPLPADVFFGASTAAYQVEGSVTAAGRGASIWDTFSREPGNTLHGDTGDIACRHFTRWAEDLDLLAELGVGAYRFSVSWPRVQPDGKGAANQDGLDFYRRILDGILGRGILPVVTLYHFDLPQPLQDAGGWPERDTASRFADYASLVGEALGPDVGLWVTLNEPWCSAWLGYGSGYHAPGLRSVGLAAAAHHHLLLAHGKAVQAIRGVTSAAAVGLALNPVPVRPATGHPADVAAARRVDGNRNRLFLEPLVSGRYPADMLAHYAGHTPGFGVIQNGDLDTIATPIDFLGLNYYSPVTVADESRTEAVSAAGYSVDPRPRDLISTDLRVLSAARPAFPRTAMDWEIEPEGLTELLLRVHRDCPRLPLIVTENGAACDDYIGPDGVIRDLARIDYLDRHIRAMLQARTAGVDVRGYLIWGLLDNFEWADGYSKRFGLVWVDYPTGTRIPKSSFRWYRDVLRRRALLPLLEAMARLADEPAASPAAPLRLDP